MTVGSPQGSGWRRYIRKGLAALTGFVCVVGLLGIVGFGLSRELLCIDSGDVKADALVVLGGGSFERAERAAELFLGGAAPRIVVSGMGDAEPYKRLLVSKGVPAASVETEPKSRTTRQNARFSIPLLRALGAKRVIIVTTWYHSRRALHSFQHYAPDIQFYSRPSYHRFPHARWSLEGVSGYVRSEYLKLAGYWVCYGVCPF
jgi:uncharacterized SAM-binding protein YcdF (DUF218 family)